jgi:polysaccharide biosynthesis/export protein
MKFLIRLLLISLLFTTLSSCRVLYPNIMYRMKDYQYFELAQKQLEQYIIQSGDELSIMIYSRDGFKLIDVLASPGIGSGQSMSTYAVDKEGFARIPVLGDFYVKGYTEAELERILAEKFAGLFVDPYVIAKVMNRRAIVFRGSSASVITLNRTPTSLLEVLGAAGGLSSDLKAYKIKIIRGDLKNPEVHLVDLSTLEGVRKTDLIIQGNDIIYIEQRRVVVNDILTTFMPYVSFVTTIASLIVLATTLGNR